MDKIDHIYVLHRLLRQRRTPVTRADLMRELDCSEQTFYRTLSTMRTHLKAPIEFDKDASGYHYSRDAAGDAYELPGLWFSARELQALLVFNAMLESLEPGLLGEQLAPFKQRVSGLLEHRRLGLAEATNRVRVLAMAARPAGTHFRAVAGATLQRRQLLIAYEGRARRNPTERIISPQQIVYYRDNWYADAWCHLRNDLRSFAIDRIQSAVVLESAANAIDKAKLIAHYADAYGIFAGKANKTALLWFSAERARWVADERWHPNQRGHFLIDGRYELKIPYRDDRELIMDIMRHGPQVEVIAPPALRTAVATQLKITLEQYADKNHSC